MSVEQILASPGGAMSCVFSVLCCALVGVILFQQARQSWEPLLQDDLPAMRIYSHVDTIWTLRGKGLRSGILVIGPNPGARAGAEAGAGAGAEAGGQTASGLSSASAFTFNFSSPEGQPEFLTITPLELQASRGPHPVAILSLPVPSTATATAQEGQDTGQEQGLGQQAGVQEQEHQSDLQAQEGQQKEQQQQQTAQQQQAEQQSGQPQQQGDKQQSEQQSGEQEQGGAQAGQQAGNQQRGNEQQQQQEQQQPQEQQQQPQQQQQQQQQPGGSAEAAAAEAPAVCPGCDLLRLLRYNKPLNETPPDEPLKYFRDAPPSPTPLVLNGSSRFYVLEAKPDRCAGVMHKRFALKCAVAEAKALNRQLAVHMTACVSRGHTKRALDQWVPFSTYLDLDLISKENHVDIVYAEQLAEAMIRAQEEGRGAGLSLKTFDKHYPVQRLRDEEGATTVVMRKPQFWENGFDICFDPSSKELADHMNPRDLTYNHHLVAIGDEIVRKLGGAQNYVTVHVRRGDKTRRPEKWPHVEQDTRPESLRKKLPKFVEPGSVLYIATNEDTPGFFDPLKDMYTIYMLEDFTHLWSRNSTWFEEFSKLLKTDNPEFDIYMKGVVDDHIGIYAKKTVETFNDLTDDPRNGIDVPP